MRCSKCGSQNPKESIYCNKCGEHLDGEAVETVTGEGRSSPWPPPDAYLARRFLGTYSYSTKSAAKVIYGVAIVITAVGSLLLAINLGILWSGFSFTPLMSFIYISWRIGRQGAGWKG